MKFIKLNNKSDLQSYITSGQIDSDSLVFIIDSDQIYLDGTYYTAVPKDGQENQFLKWKADGEATWEDLNTYVDTTDLLAYGVQWTEGQIDPHLTRIGNLSMHKTLPIQSQMRGCIAQGKEIQYWLNEEDWNYRKDPVVINMSYNASSRTLTPVDGTTQIFTTFRYNYSQVKINGSLEAQITDIRTATSTASIEIISDPDSLATGIYPVEIGAVLNGYEGTVKVYIPEFYIRGYEDGNIRKVYISTVQIDPSWTKQPACLLDAWGCTFLQSKPPTEFGYLSTIPVNSPVAVCNQEEYLRGGGNRVKLDQYISTDKFRSDLNKPASYVFLANARNYAKQIGSHLLSYEEYKNIFYWLWVIEYANFNSQEAFNDELTSEGYHQGGMGAGLTTINGTYWALYNDYRSLTPCGQTRKIGNGTGYISVTFKFPANSEETSFNTYNSSFIHWRGIENPFGDIWLRLDGYKVDGHPEDRPIVYVVKDPEDFDKGVTDSSVIADRSYILPAYGTGRIVSTYLSEAADIIPKSVNSSATATQYRCDSMHMSSTANVERVLDVGGRGSYGNSSGLNCMQMNDHPQNLSPGYRLFTVTYLD